MIPFCFLPASAWADLSEHAAELRFEPGAVIVEQGDDADRRVFLLVEGVVEALDERSGQPVGRIHAKAYFGERAALFAEGRRFTVRAVEPARVLCLEGERFLELFGQSPAFAQGMASILRHKQGIFVAFDRFMAELLRALGTGEIVPRHLLAPYRDLEPALHAGANSDELDLSGLLYAVRRLPDNVTRCFAYYVTEALPHHQSRPAEVFAPVATAARRRGVFELLPGKNLVVIRDGISDVVDFITCLFLFVIEAKKLRHRMLDIDLLAALTRGDPSYPLPFSDAELAELGRIWPEDTRARLREVLLHHEDIHVSVFRHLDNYNSAHAEAWTIQIAALTAQALGAKPALLPDDLPIHVISSNTHSVCNCLSPWLGAHGDDIAAWGRSEDHPLTRERWFNDTDCVYALARDYFRAHPEQAREKAQQDGAAGIFALTEPGLTGIEVQLIDLARLREASAVDPALPAFDRGLVINIDYAFGQQAEHIIANLIALFGSRIRSVNVLGKAGALRGRRGDILAATGFIEQSRDLFQPIPNDAVDVGHLRSLTDRAVHVGPVLTVAGTLLQNRRMLEFNKHVWGCTGLEMEGTYYLAHVRESMDRGVLRRDVALRFLYYVSDLPLDHTANLSGALQATEGIPPLYAITREILSASLGRRCD